MTSPDPMGYGQTLSSPKSFPRHEEDPMPRDKKNPLKKPIKSPSKPAVTPSDLGSGFLADAARKIQKRLAQQKKTLDQI